VASVEVDEEGLAYLRRQGLVEDRGGVLWLCLPRPVESKEGYGEVFEAAWTIYPKRDGSNPKAGAWKAWQSRLKEGESELDMLAGTKRYARWVREKDRWGTEFVCQAQTFFGPRKLYAEEYSGDGEGSFDGGRYWDRNPRDPTVPVFTQREGAGR
jgi:hypothetical protein